MLRNKVFTALQKTYDDSYLSCSTAVYYESQGDETEATRHWKHALAQIYEHRATRITPDNQPQTDTERALVEAVKQLELQCKERIDLLEALRVSRSEGLARRAAMNISKDTARDANSLDDRSKGSIGQGTIPAVTYSELSRPTMPSRPSLPLRLASARISPPSSGGSQLDSELGPTTDSRSRSQSPHQLARSEKTLRTASPEKHTMRTTLRTSKTNDKPSRSTRRSPKPAEGSSKAATLAWSALGSSDRSLKVASPNTNKNVSPMGSWQTTEHRRPVTSPMQWDSHSRRLVTSREADDSTNGSQSTTSARHFDDYSKCRSSHLSVSAASSALTSMNSQDAPPDKLTNRSERINSAYGIGNSVRAIRTTKDDKFRKSPPSCDLGDHSERQNISNIPMRPKGVTKRPVPQHQVLSKKGMSETKNSNSRQGQQNQSYRDAESSESEEVWSYINVRTNVKQPKRPGGYPGVEARSLSQSSEEGNFDKNFAETSWETTKTSLLKNLPSGIDEGAAKQILNEIVVQGDEVQWGDIAGLEIAKNALRETVVYPFLRPDLFMGLREPARGMLLFGPPGTGKTMLARAVATESKSTFFSISASSLTSKYLGESEKLVRALFGLARSLAPSIIFVDEIDSLLSQRSGSGEHEATRRIKTEFLIQWSDLQRAAAGRETTERDKERGDANRVLVLAATNLPWEIDEAARRRFVRRQYIPLPESHTRETQLRTLLGQQKHGLSASDIDKLVELTDGFSGSDITALAKDAAMGPLRSLGEALLHMKMDDIRPIQLIDFEASLGTIRPSVGKAGLKEYEDWAREFGERGG